MHLPPDSARWRRALLLGSALVVAVISCGREITAPATSLVRFARGFSLLGQFPPAYQVAAGTGLVPFTRVHIRLLHADGKVALDTTVDFPAGADELTLSLTVPLLAGAPTTGEPMSAGLDYINAAGQTVFSGSIPVTVTPTLPGAPAPPPVQVPVQYTGTGSNAGSIAASLSANTGLVGSTVTIGAQVFSTTGTLLSGAPVVFSSSAPTVASLASPTVGTVTLVARGKAYIRAQTLTGQADSALLTVTLPASALTLSSGGLQTADAGSALPLPVVAKVAASDGIGVSGVTVNFAAPNGGSVSPASAVSDANGLASTTWTLGTVPGPQGMTISSSGLSGSPIPVTATARVLPAAKFEILSPPQGATAGASIGSVQVRALDIFNNVTPAFAGDVSVSLLGGPAGATLSGTATATAVAGVATFTGLSVNRPGTYSLQFGASGLTAAQSAPFSITAGAAAKLVFTTQPSSAAAGAVVAPSVVLVAQDALGNTATSFSGSVAIALGTNAAGATLGGTTPRSASLGVVQFNDLSVNRAGTGYILTASATGLTGATSDPFNVVAGAATRLVVDALPSSVQAGTTITPAVTATAQDAQGNTVTSFNSSVSIAFGTNTTGATLSGTKTRTAAAGVVRFDDLSVDRLGSGYTLVLSPAGLASVTSTAFSVAAGPASHITVGNVSSGGSAGSVITLPVTAFDALGNIATSFTGNVTVAIGTNPSAGTLAGTLTRAAVAGVATFDNLTIDKSGTGYTLVASATGLGTSTTGAFSLTAGAPAAIVLISGGSQSAAGGTALSPITVQLTDGAANGVAGATIAFASATGGGSVSPSTATTNAQGQATTTWTLGGTAGAQTMTATYGALANAISLTVGATATGAAAAASIAPDSGMNQTPTVGTQAAQPLVVLVRDGSGNPLSGQTVLWTMVTGTGRIDSTSTVTNALGRTRVRLTADTVSGADSVTATVGALSTGFRATGLPGTATHLTVSKQPPTTGTSAVNFAGALVSARALDVYNNRATAFVGTVTASIASGPASAVLSGTLTATASLGTASFNSLSLDKAGAYTLGFASTGLTSTTSATITIGAAAATTIAADSGTAQSGAPSAALAAPFVVLVTDAAGNPVSGTGITWAVTVGGGSLVGSTTSTDANGRARTTLTLGAVAGTNTVTATSGALAGSPVTFNATGAPVIANRMWTGTTSTSWITASNWSPAIVPVAGDSVQIGSAVNAPVIPTANPVSLKHLYLQAGGSLHTSSAVTLNGNLSAQGTFVLLSGGTVTMSAGTVQGTITDSSGAANGFTVTGAAGMTGNFLTSGDVATLGNSTFYLNGHTLTVGGSLSTGGTSGMLDMTTLGDSAWIGVNVLIGGSGRTDLHLTKGNMVVMGGLTATSAYSPGGTHQIIFAASTPQTVTAANPANLGFRNILVTNPAGVTLPSGATIKGTLNLSGPLTTANLTISGDGASQGTLVDPSGNLSVTNLTITGTATPVAAATPTITATNIYFTGTLNPSPVQAGDLTINGHVFLNGGWYTVNGHTLTVNGAFDVNSFANGKLIMTNAADSVLITGDATFAGDYATMNAGKLVLLGNFAQNTNLPFGPTFRASAPHTTIFSGTANQTIAFMASDTTTTSTCVASCFGNLVIAKPSGKVTFNTRATVAGTFDVTSADSVKTAGITGSPKLTVIGAITTAAAPGVHFTSVATGANNTLGAATTLDTLTFIGGASQNISGAYNVVKIGGAPTVSGDFSTTGALSVVTGGTLAPNGHKISVGGKLTTSGTGVLSETNALDSVFVADSANFAGGTSGLTAGFLRVGANFNATGLAFDASGSHTLEMNAASVAQYLTWTTPTAGHGINNLVFRGNSQKRINSNMNVRGNVLMAASLTTQGVLDAGGNYTVTVGSGAGVSMEDSSSVSGGAWRPGKTTFAVPATLLPANLSGTSVMFAGGTTALSANLSAASVTVDGSSTELQLNSHALKLNGNTFTTQNGGVLRMSNALDTLDTQGGTAAFNGGSESGKLTAGFLGTAWITQAGPNGDSYSATAPHITAIGSGVAGGMQFANPGFGAGASHFGNFRLTSGSTMNVRSNVYVDGRVQTRGNVQYVLTANIVTNPLLVSKGIDSVSSLRFNDVRWEVTTGDTIMGPSSGVQFNTMTTTTQPFFTIRRGGGGAGWPTLTNWQFNTVPTGTAVYLALVDTLADANPLTVTMTGTTPSVSSGLVSLTTAQTGGAENAVLNGWPSGAAAIWSGAASTAWTNGLNWDIGIPPLTTTNVTIPNGTPNAPTISAASVSIKDLTVNANAVLTVNLGTSGQSVSVNGNLVVNPGAKVDLTGDYSALNAFGNVTTDTAGTTGVTTCGATQHPYLNMQAGTHTVTGKFCNLGIFGNISAAGPVTVTGTGVTGNITVVTAGGALTINGKTVSAGQLSTSSSGTLVMQNAADSLYVSGTASFTGGNTTGLLTAGTLVVSGSSISATGLAFDASATHTTILNGSALQTIGFGSAVAGHGWGKLIMMGSGRKNFSGDQYIVGDVILSKLLTVQPVDGSYRVRIGGNLVDSAAFGHGGTLAGGGWGGSTSLWFTGTPTIIPDTLSLHDVNFVGGTTVSLPNNLITNYVNVYGAGSNLKLNGHRIFTHGNYVTVDSGGTIEMTNPADSLDAGNMGWTMWNGGNENGKLTAGTIITNGFYQGYDYGFFLNSNAHALSFASSGTQVVLQGSFQALIGFKNPGTGAGGSHFYSVSTPTGLPVGVRTDVFVDSLLTSEVVGSHWYSDSAVQGVSRKVTAKGFYNATKTLNMDGVRLLLVDGGNPTNAVNLMTFTHFANITYPLLEFNRTTSNPSPASNNFGAVTFGAGGYFIKNSGTANVVTGAGNSACNSGTLATGQTCPGTITAALSGPWQNASTWTPAIVPDSLSSVSIPAGLTVTMGAANGVSPWYTKDLTLTGSATVAQGIYDLEVHGNIVGDTTVGGVTCTSGITYQPDGGPKTVQGRFCRYHSGSKITLGGLMTVSETFHVHDSTFTFNGHKVVTKEAWVGTGNLGSGSGSIVMANAADSLMVSDSLVAGNQFGTGLASTLSNGLISVAGNFKQVGNSGTGYFNSSAGTQEWLTGTGSVAFADTTTSGFGSLTVSGPSRSFSTVARVGGSMFVIGSASVTGAAGRIKLAGDLYATSTSSIASLSGFEIGGILSDTGTFNPDTTVFTGGTLGVPQVIPQNVNGSVVSYKSIVVTGNAHMYDNSAYTLGAGGSLIVRGSVASQLRLGFNNISTSVNVPGNLVTAGSGALRMNDTLNTSLTVSGNATFGGASTNGLLTAGYLQVNGNFAQSGAATAFAPSGNFSTTLAGTGGQTLSFASPGTGATASHFNGLTVSTNGAGRTMTSDVYVDGTFSHQINSPDSVTISGAGVKLVTRGVSVAGGPTGTGYLAMVNMQLQLAGSCSTMYQLDGVHFRGASSLGSNLDIACTGAMGASQFKSLLFTAVPSGGNLLNISGTPTSVTLQGPSPAYISWILGTHFLNPNSVTTSFMP